MTTESLIGQCIFMYVLYSFGLGKFCPTPGEFDHHFLPLGRELDKKFARVAGISSLKKIFPGVALGGGGYPVENDWDVIRQINKVNNYQKPRRRNLPFLHTGGVRAMFLGLKFHLKAIFWDPQFANMNFTFFWGKNFQQLPFSLGSIM